MADGSGTTLDSVHAEILDVKKEMQLVTSIVRGNELTGLRGLTTRVEYLEEKVKFLLNERERQRWTLRGIALGLGITGLSGVGNLVALLKLLSEVGS